MIFLYIKIETPASKILNKQDSINAGDVGSVKVIPIRVVAIILGKNPKMLPEIYCG